MGRHSTPEEQGETAVSLYGPQHRPCPLITMPAASSALAMHVPGEAEQEGGDGGDASSAKSVDDGAPKRRRPLPFIQFGSRLTAAARRRLDVQWQW